MSFLLNKVNGVDALGFNQFGARTFGEDTTTNDVNNNTDLQGQSINSNVDLSLENTESNINGNTNSGLSTTESNVNGNTTTEVEKLKGTPVSVVLNYTQGSSYQNFINYTGKGYLSFIHFAGGAGISTSGLRITIDGVVYLLEINITNVIVITSTSATDDYLYNTKTIASGADFPQILDIPFKQSCLVQGFSDGTGTRKFRALYYKFV